MVVKGTIANSISLLYNRIKIYKHSLRVYIALHFLPHIVRNNLTVINIRPLIMRVMQVDHVIPINGWSEQGEDTLDNMLPACRSCNHYKSRSALEGFRKMVENMPTVLMRDSVTYKNAVRFGLVTPTPHPVKFYFEQLGR